MKRNHITLWMTLLVALAASLSPTELTASAEDSTAVDESTTQAYDSESSQEEEHFTSGDFTYIPNDDGTAVLYQCITEETDLVVPAELDGYTVTEIDGGAFVNQDSIVTLTLPETIEFIDDSCFYGCNSIEEFIVAEDNPAYMTQDGVLYSSDGQYLIAYPTGLDATTFTIPDGVIEIWSSAFANAPLTSVVFPDSLLYIDDWSFAYTPLTSLELPESLLEIGNDSFIYCNGLTEITFPSSLEIIGAEAFAACENLAEIELQDGLQTVKMSAFAGTAMTEVTIPASVTAIGFSAFGYETDTVTQVEDFVIYGTVGSQAQTYCTEIDEENDYENHFVFRSVMTEEVDTASNTVQAIEEDTAFWQTYGKWILISAAALAVLIIGVVLVFSGRKKAKKDSSNEETK